MTTSLKTRDETGVRFDSQDDRFDRTSIILHWVTVLLITVQFGSIWARETISHQSGLAALLLSLHRAMGLLTWAVVAARLIWRRYFAHVPDFPTNMPIVQQLVAKANDTVSTLCCWRYRPQGWPGLSCADDLSIY
jgi:cytochrome b561